ncbi:hypothetical protein EMIHUDRAFT_210626 [Emiliania huxleyi CCMP1516]|uniref:Uncharacterized protein n=2 Tax=Emiliania huxleyi TaxID=2903 RepID=A0A0D3IYF1_EMIH1|nr:hypothetical protein EMIHUDRAFT_210626 [Emiliania huxleyi CCMP1516]EOD16286.1 hypothetical protein EMIHUDRAFT_210626 [Emiliania huxleyi CCMP1516]|eukprot:XP_005768715.1 hypothetical protein EMIHUDRAFT_210626 [Emiliania huxleyi CCMP1516]
MVLRSPGWQADNLTARQLVLADAPAAALRLRMAARPREVVERQLYLWETDPDTEEEDEGPDVDYLHVLWLAVKGPDMAPPTGVDNVQAILDMAPHAAQLLGPDGDLPLHRAVRAHTCLGEPNAWYLPMVSLLIGSYGAAVIAHDEDGATPLHHAAMDLQIDMLLRAHPDAVYTQSKSTRETPLHLAVRFRYPPAIVNVLLAADAEKRSSRLRDFWGNLPHGALTFFYINQLWSLSNVCTFFVMYFSSYEQQLTACRLLERGDIDAVEARARELGCDGIEARHHTLLGVMGTLLIQLWISCYLARTYSETLQDLANDADDAALVQFVWARRRETWQQLRRFEDVVGRQFEELRASLVSKQSLRAGSFR